MQDDHRARVQGSRAMLWPHGPPVSVTGLVFLCFRVGACLCGPQKTSLKFTGCAYGNTRILWPPRLVAPRSHAPLWKHHLHIGPASTSEELWKEGPSAAAGTPLNPFSFESNLRHYYGVHLCMDRCVHAMVCAQGAKDNSVESALSFLPVCVWEFSLPSLPPFSFKKSPAEHPDPPWCGCSPCSMYSLHGFPPGGLIPASHTPHRGNIPPHHAILKAAQATHASDPPCTCLSHGRECGSQPWPT